MIKVGQNDSNRDKKTYENRSRSSIAEGQPQSECGDETL